jgi:hypothetical protein
MAQDSKNPGVAPLPSRREIEIALRAAGLSHRQARKFISAGWPALVSARQAELDELRAQLEDLRSSIKSV